MTMPNEKRDWSKAAGILVLYLAVGTATIGFSHRAIFPAPSEETLNPRELAEYLCRMRFESQVPSAFLTAAPVTEPRTNGFQIGLTGTSQGRPIEAERSVRGHQVMEFGAAQPA